MNEQRQATLHRIGDLDPLPDGGAGFERKAVLGDELMLLQAWIPAGTEVAAHEHPHEQMSYIIQGRVQFWSGPDDTEVVLEAGDVVHIPGNVVHRAKALEDTVQFDAFHPTRPDLLEG